MGQTDKHGFLNLDQEITDDDSLLGKVAVEQGCHICGGKLVEIRGRYPNEPRREVCPTCLKERLERIRDESSPDYGISYQKKIP